PAHDLNELRRAAVVDPGGSDLRAADLEADDLLRAAPGQRRLRERRLRARQPAHLRLRRSRLGVVPFLRGALEREVALVERDLGGCDGGLLRRRSLRLGDLCGDLGPARQLWLALLLGLGGLLLRLGFLGLALGLLLRLARAA